MASPLPFAAQQAMQAIGLPITRSLTTGRIGSFYCVALVHIATTDTVIDHALARVPSGYLVARAQSDGVVYDGTADGADWTGATITLRASVAGSYTILIC